MAKRLYLTTECVKLTIGFFGGIGGLTLREFMTHSKLSKVWERWVKLIVEYTLSNEATECEGEKYYTDITHVSLGGSSVGFWIL